MIKSGLVVDEPWIGKILAGEKVWEMRSNATKKRELIGLIRKGSGLVMGIARVVDTEGPFSRREMIEHADKHKIPEEMISSGKVDKWCHAWILADVSKLDEPVAYSHPSGAVTWVSVSDQVARQIQLQIANSEPTKNRCSEKGGETVDARDQTRNLNKANVKPSQVPFAKDGTHFGPHLKRAGSYQVGAKGDEKRYSTFAEALDALKKMPTARWRRPNAKNNWGIVTAVRWAPAQE